MHSVGMHLPAQRFLDLVSIYQNILHDPTLQIYQTVADADTEIQQVGCFVPENLYYVYRTYFLNLYLY